MVLKRYLVLSGLAALTAAITDGAGDRPRRADGCTIVIVGMWVTGDGQIRQELLRDRAL